LVRQVLRWLALRVPQVRHLLAERQRLVQRVHDLEEAQTRARPRVPRKYGLCEVVNPAKYDDPEWIAIHHDLERYAIDKHCFRNRSGEIYRKGWEWTQCVYGLRKLGMIQPHHSALGVGVGRECVIYYLADWIARVTATDLYGGTAWTGAGGREADLGLLEQSKAACPPSVDFSKITFETQDGTNLTYEDRCFDFCWSLSSIEHFGGHSASAKAVREMARVTRPGGIVAIATELLLLDEYRHEEFFTRVELDEWLVRASPELELIEDIDFDALPISYLIDSVTVPAGVDRRRRHVVLNNGNLQWTSVMLFLRKRS
jgi:SAM-dependent methyltransferase